jgi:hypothetical protein
MTRILSACSVFLILISAPAFSGDAVDEHALPGIPVSIDDAETEALCGLLQGTVLSAQLEEDRLPAVSAAPSSLTGSGPAAFAAGAASARLAGCLYNSCPEPKSCGSWSAWYDCGGLDCAYDQLCASKGTEATIKLQERFRDCKIQNQTPCREYEHRSVRLHCGCGGQ